VQNTDSNGRFHTDWLNMIYPRLKLAKDLLTEDGVIFISIDDNEVENLKKICNEIFGEANFIVSIIWKKRSTPPNDQVIGAAHEYVLIYAKRLLDVKLCLRQRSDEQLARYKNPDNHPKGPWTAGDLGANVKGGRYVASLNYPITNPNTGEKHFPPQNGNWRFSKDTIDRLLANNEIYFGEDGKGRPKLKRFLSDVKDRFLAAWAQGRRNLTAGQPYGLLLVRPSELITLFRPLDDGFRQFLPQQIEIDHTLHLPVLTPALGQHIRKQLPDPLDISVNAVRRMHLQLLHLRLLSCYRIRNFLLYHQKRLLAGKDFG
jgi:adenine specific DNA methylase Mod